MLRRRTAALFPSLTPRARAFVRLVPLLLEARFRLPALDREPPGLAQPLRRRRWGRLCAELELPPPLAFSQRRPLVQSVVFAPTASGAFELLVVPVAALAPVELTRLSDRVEAIAEFAERHAPELEVRMAGVAELTPALFAWAGVIAGDLPPLSDEGSFDWRDAFARAPTPLLRCLMLLVPPDATSPLTLLRTSVVPSTSAAAFLAAWGRHPVARDVITLAAKPLSMAELDGLSRQLRRACLLALRSIPLRERASARAVVRPAIFARRVPPVLRPLLEATISRHAPREVKRDGWWQLEIDGLVFLRARTQEQLRAHALAESPRLVAADAGPVHGRLAQAVSHLATRAIVQLEKGPVRHLVVSVPAFGRPCARRVDAEGLFEFLLARHRRGMPVEIVPTPGCEPTLIARCTQLLATRLKTDESVALQLGPRVLMLEGARVRRMPISHALTRPRRVTWIAEQADMARSLRKPLATGLPTVQLVAYPEGDGAAALFAIDATGHLYRELVARDALEPTLHEIREVLRQADPPSILAASVHPQLTSLAGRVADAGVAPLRLELELTSQGDQAVLDDERFGTGAELPWSALAEAILSRWPPGTWGHVGVARVKAPARTAPLALLAARARVLRRVQTHLRRIARQLRAA